MKNYLALGGISLLLLGCTNVYSDGTRPESVPADSMAYEDNAVARMPSARKVMLNGAGSADKSASSYFQESSRMMAYTAGFTLTVKERDKALDEVKVLAESLGGYLVSSSRGNMVLKVPVKNADEFMKKSVNYGKISDFRISAEDLTDTITDLTVRLDNLRKLRTRLTELLAKAKNVDEMIKVERELNRVTTEIERMDAQLQNNKNRVTFVTFNVGIIEEHGAIPAGTPQAISRFTFLKQLAATELAGTEDEPLFGLDLPEKFVAVKFGGQQGNAFTATTSDDCIFRTWRVDIPDDSALEFWEKVICRALVAYDDYSNVKCFPVKLDGRPAVKITAEQTAKNGIQLYMAVISVKSALGDDELQIVEFFGPQEAFKQHEKSVESVTLK